MKGQPMRRRMRFAVAGIVAAFRTEQSFRIHCLLTVGALVALIVLRPGPVWWALLALAAALVMGFELLNSALEALIDHVHPDVHPAIGAAKDMASAAVMVSGAGALGVAICMLIDRRDIILGWFGGAW